MESARIVAPERGTTDDGSTRLRVVVGPEAEAPPVRPPLEPSEIITPPITARTAKAARKKWWKLANKLGYKKERPAPMVPAGGVKAKAKARKRKAKQDRKRNRK